MNKEEQKHLMQSYYALHEKYYKKQQENQQLKENNLAMQEEMARTWAKHDKLKSTLEEIREYINKNVRHEYRNGRNDEFYLELNQKELNDLLQIIDKGVNNE